MVNLLVMLDDFSKDNGSTFLLPKSHLNEYPSELDKFYDNAIQIEGVKGDIIVWNSNLLHCSAPNKTNKNRRCLPITLSIPSYKSLLDYPTALGEQNLAKK